MSESIYLNEWEDSKFFGMAADFAGLYITKEEYEAKVCPWADEEYWRERKEEMRQALESEQYQGIEVLLASYGSEGYEGSAFVLFRKDGRLYEVHGGHCSCYGLEGQWEPEETSPLALMFRIEKGGLGDCEYSGNKFVNELRQVIAGLDP